MLPHNRIINKAAVLSAAPRFSQETENPSHNAQEFGVGAKSVYLKEGGAIAYCKL